ncbi:MAG TPA: hypothetical protein VII63_08810 [Caulobacteraceae bacterium]
MAVGEPGLGEAGGQDRLGKSRPARGGDCADVHHHRDPGGRQSSYELRQTSPLMAMVARRFMRTT